VSALQVCVIGAGLMGAQIGCEYALGGHDVALAARDLDALKGRIDAAFSTLTELDLVSEHAAEAGKGRIRRTSEVADAAGGCDVIVESLPEDLRLKTDVLRDAVDAAPDALVASNTSSLRVTDIGRALGAGDRTVGTHYWNPPLLMPLVEIVAGDESDPARVDFAADVVAGLGKTPVNVADIPGVVWNRLQFERRSRPDRARPVDSGFATGPRQRRCQQRFPGGADPRARSWTGVRSARCDWSLPLICDVRSYSEL
jgi:3-hydroxybutyryl-CoA dehydrogenase